jgi:hypothetical protein
MSSRITNRYLSTGFFVAMILISQQASATCCSVVNGQVGTVEPIGSGAGAPGAYDFRVYLIGNPVVCNGNTWAYINTTDANYQALVASLLMAKAIGSSVSFAIAQDSAGYCQLAYMSVS